MTFKKTTLLLSTLALLSGIAVQPNISFASSRPNNTENQSACHTPFVDIADHWAEKAICTLYQADVINGISEKNFEPNRAITRAEFLKITLEALDYSVYPVQSAAFTDTKAGEWHYRYITFAHAKGFIKGYDDGHFAPDSPISRAEALSILIKIAGYSSADTSFVNVHFNDVDSTDWFANAVAIGIEKKWVEGYGDGSFRPDNSISRAEAATVILRASKNL